MLKLIRGDYRGEMLINIIVALGISVILLVVAMPNIRKFQKNIALNGAAREILGDLRTAQQLSITEQTQYAVTFSTSSRSFSLIKKDTATSTIHTKFLPSTIDFSSISNQLSQEVSFNSFGAATVSGQIILTNNNNSTSTIDIKPSGYVQIR